MKKFSPLILVLSVLLIVLQSCGDDDTKFADVLVTSHRQTGVFYKVDKKTGETKEIFTPTLSGGTLKEIRAFVYHPKENLFYASASTSIYGEAFARKGYLYSMNPKTKVATLINNNDGDGGDYAVWDAINNWAVAEDDSLVGIGDFNDDGNGIVKFGTDGGRSLKTIEAPVCCGNGMLYDKKTGVMQVATGWDTDDGEIDIVTIDAEGVVTSTITITTFTGFPDDLSITWLTMKAMAKDKNGDVYAILYHYDLGKSYLVTVDIEGEEITYLSTLGVDEDNQYNSLAFIPGNFAK